jgi:hypothetical protein
VKIKYEDMGNRPFLHVPVIDERPATVAVDGLDLMIYGFLLYRLGNKDPALRSVARTALSTNLRIDKKAVDRSVTILVSGGAVAESNGRVIAVEPTGTALTWFRFQKNVAGKDWRERFIYDRVYLPRAHTAISIKTNLLYWHLVKLGHAVDRMPGYLQVGGHTASPGFYLTAEYLAKGLRCDRKTISRGIARLKQLGLITVKPKGTRSFVVGIPPIGAKADLWRDSWGTTRRSDESSFEITAESLFGLHSQDPLVPADDYARGIGVYMRAFGIKGKVVEEIKTRIIKYQIPPREWESMVATASRDHKKNQEEKPGQFTAGHCGHLFSYMLDEHVKQQQAQACLAKGSSPRTYDEMQADELLVRLRVTTKAARLLRQAVQAEYLELRNGACVPCRLNWETVATTLQAADRGFAAFKEAIAGRIFGSGPSHPDCEWYEAWMANEQIPLPDDSPMEALRLDARERTKIRTHAKKIAGEVYANRDNEAAVAHLTNDLVRLGCWQASSPSVQAVNESISNISGEAFAPVNKRAAREKLTETEELCLLG